MGCRFALKAPAKRFQPRNLRPTSTGLPSPQQSFGNCFSPLSTAITASMSSIQSQERRGKSPLPSWGWTKMRIPATAATICHYLPGSVETWCQGMMGPHANGPCCKATDTHSHHQGLSCLHSLSASPAACSREGWPDYLRSGMSIIFCQEQYWRDGGLPLPTHARKHI